jgi:hypothetical protein
MSSPSQGYIDLMVGHLSAVLKEIAQKDATIAAKDAEYASLSETLRIVHDDYDAARDQIERLEAELALLRPKPFPIFDATRDGLLPEFEFAGLIPESEFYAGAKGPIDTRYVQEVTIPRWFANHVGAGRCMPDIEFYWSKASTDPVAVTPLEVETIPLRAVRALKAYRPGLKVGPYSPIERSLNHLTGGAAAIVSRTDAWYERNRVYEPLYAEMDEFWVSLYCIVKDSQLSIANIEEDYITSNLAMARRFSGDKSVYAVLCPYFHPTSGRTGLMPLDRWQKYVSLSRQKADGIGIWLDTSTNVAELAQHMALLKA